MNKNIINGIIGRLEQSKGRMVSFPHYVTEDGTVAERRKAYYIRHHRNQRGNDLIDVLVQTQRDKFRYRTMRVDRIRSRQVIIDGRTRKRFFMEIDHN